MSGSNPTTPGPSAGGSAGIGTTNPSLSGSAGLNGRPCGSVAGRC
jgi:hypothetical protein